MKKLTIILFLVLSNVILGQSNNSIYDQNKETVIEYFKTETLGGKLDFAMKMQNDDRSFYLYDKIIYNRKDFAIFLWGQAIKKTNKFSKKKAAKLWEEIKQRKLTKAEKRALYRGFETELTRN